jgi:hypothetical protein
MTALMDSTGAVAFNHQLVAKAQASYGQSRTKIQAQQWAEALFQQAIQKGRVNKLTSFLRRRQTQLWQLHPSEPTRQLGQRQEEQVQLDGQVSTRAFNSGSPPSLAHWMLTGSLPATPPPLSPNPAVCRALIQGRRLPRRVRR